MNYEEVKETQIDKNDVKHDIRIANSEIRKRHRYFCGLVTDEEKDNIGCGDLFFESPDGQNGELYMELKNMGYRNAGYNAEYYWKVRKDGFMVEFTEGDIYIKEIK
jgi:hypothetical protein